MIEFFQCVWPRVRRSVEDFLGSIGLLMVILLVVSFLGCLLSGAAAACLPAWFAGALNLT